MTTFHSWKLEIASVIPALNDEKNIDRKGIPPGLPGGIPFLSMYAASHSAGEG